MKKTIPFSKDIKFNTNIYEIVSISLEHTLKLNNGSEITGEFIISGDYKENDYSLNKEPFIFNIPFDIILDNEYSKDDIKLDIDDFNYDIVSQNELEVNISISIDGVEKIKEDNLIEIIDDTIEEDKDLFLENKEEAKEVIKEEMVDSTEVTSIFDNFNNKDDKYVTYHVHIFREKDDINEIIKLYNITKEELEEYNDINSITIGSKIIIPSNE